MSKGLEVLKANENNIVIILSGKKPMCCPICKKRDGKFYQINETNFEFYDYLTFQEYTCLSNTNEYGPISYFIDDNIKVIEFDEIEDFKTNNNPVNHPSHYNDGNIEVIDFIEDKKLGFHLGNAVKYISRAGKKDVSKTREDIEKAIWYLERYLEVTKNDK